MRRVNEKEADTRDLIRHILPADYEEKDIFTGRKREMEHFSDHYTKILKESEGERFYHILLYTGAKGVGKSALLEKLIETHKESINYAFFDFKNFTGTMFEVILSLKNQLEENSQFTFPLTNYAIYRIFKESGDESLRSKDLSDIINNRRSAIALLIIKSIIPALDIGMEFLSIIEKYFNYNIKQEISSRITNTEIREYIKLINDSKINSIEENIAILFAYDLALNNRKKKRKNKTATVIFLDTFDSINNNSADYPIYDWLTNNKSGLFLKTPGVVWVIAECGNNLLPDWQAEVVPIKPFERAEADSFFLESGVADTAIRKLLFEKSHGIPSKMNLYCQKYKALSKAKKDFHSSCDPETLENNNLLLLLQIDEDTAVMLATLSLFTYGWSDEMIKEMSKSKRWDSNAYQEAIECKAVKYSPSLMKYSLDDEVREFLHNRNTLLTPDEIIELISPLLDSPKPNTALEVMSLIAYYNHTGNALQEAMRRTLSSISSYNLMEASSMLTLLDKIQIESREDKNAIASLHAYYIMKKGNVKESLEMVNDIDAGLNETISRFIKSSCLIENAKYQEAIDVAKSTRDAISDKTSVDYIKVSYNLATAYFRLEDFKESFSIENDLLEIIKEKYPNTPLHMKILNALATDYQRLGEYKKALDIGFECYMQSEKTIGKTDSRTLTYLGNIASYLSEPTGMDVSKYAREIEEHLALQTSTDDPVDVAIAISHYILDKRTAILGERHHETLDTLANLADQYNEKKDYKTALKLLKKCKRLRSEMLGGTHADTLDTISKISTTYYLMKDNENACLALKEYLDKAPDKTTEAYALNCATYKELKELVENATEQNQSDILKKWQREHTSQ